MSTFWTRVKAVAKGLKVKDGTIRQWQARGYVPHKWHFKLSQTASKYGTEISLKELNTTTAKSGLQSQQGHQ